MRLGLIADIHEHVDCLRRSLGQLREAEVDQIVVLGDVFRDGTQIEETCRLLAEAEAVGVWGNHDFGLCCDPTPTLQERYGTEVVQFMTTLQPHLVVGGCLCTHVEPWLDPHEIMDLWYFEGVPDSPDKVARIFAATAQPVTFGGHYHRWLLVTPDGIQPWRGERPIRLDADQQYFVVIGAVFDGKHAIYDTESRELTPFCERRG
jgi:hypothetical protein